MYELSQPNIIIGYLRFRVLNSKAKSTFSWPKQPVYRSYDSFVASVTHLFEDDLQSSSGLLFEFETSQLSAPRTVLFFACHQSC